MDSNVSSSAQMPVLGFRAHLLAWYDTHARDLPWRKDREPYRVWVSEIMLQQTRVAAVIEHYHEFLRRFPTLQKLSAAREASVLAAWSGLGYYRRARMLHAAAKMIAKERAGQFPATAATLLDLPGIGRYTAAAIASIAFDEPVAVVDGNVERVLDRFCGETLSDEKTWHMAGQLLDPERPGDFNQAMMELGATVCTPRAPSCLTCPVVELCATRGERSSAAKPARQKKREIHYALDCRNGRVFLVQRACDLRLMPGMWELPETEPPLPPTKKKRGSRTGKIGCRTGQPSFTLRHSITVTDYAVRVWQMPAPQAIAGRWVALEKAQGLALTGLARKILRRVAEIRNKNSII
jgi:A/G-specific adenine glycosylase